MRVLLDECVPEGFLALLPEHLRAVTAREAGLAGRKNGDLLAAAEGRFDVLVTVDQNLPWQQHLSTFSLAVVVLRARSNSLLSLRPLVPDLLRALSFVGPGQIVRLGT
jgi:predicted nuclease of predicted toxin-antitoxin system